MLANLLPRCSYDFLTGLDTCTPQDVSLCYSNPINIASREVRFIWARELLIQLVDIPLNGNLRTRTR